MLIKFSGLNTPVREWAKDNFNTYTLGHGTVEVSLEGTLHSPITALTALSTYIRSHNCGTKIADYICTEKEARINTEAHMTHNTATTPVNETYMPTYQLIPVGGVTYPEDWEPDDRRFYQAMCLLKRTGTLIMPIVVAFTGVGDEGDKYALTYELLHPQQLEMLLAYQCLAQNMTEEEYKSMPFGRAWDNMPAIVVNGEPVNRDLDRNLKGLRDADYEEAVLDTLDWEYGINEDEEPEPAQSDFNDVAVYEVPGLGYVIKVVFDYRSELPPTYTRVTEKLPSDDYIRKLRCDVEREQYFSEAAQWALQK